MYIQLHFCCNEYIVYIQSGSVYKLNSLDPAYIAKYACLLCSKKQFIRAQIEFSPPHIGCNKQHMYVKRL
jgi:hypothetical protein